MGAPASVTAFGHLFRKPAMYGLITCILQPLVQDLGVAGQLPATFAQVAAAWLVGLVSAAGPAHPAVYSGLAAASLAIAGARDASSRARWLALAAGGGGGGRG